MTPEPVVQLPVPSIPPDPTAPSEPSKEHLSFTQLSMWARCSMQYYFRYVLGLKERPSLRLVNGKSGHAAVEFNSLHKMQTKADAPTEQILDTFSTDYDLQTQILEPGDLKAGEDIGQTKDATIETLRYYRARHAERITPLAVEQEFRLEITPDEDFQEPLKPIIGRIDVIQERTEDHPLAVPHTELVDNKFVQRNYAQAKVDLNDQPTLYDLVMTRAGIIVRNLGFQLFLPPTARKGPDVVQLLRSPEYMTPEVRVARHTRLIYKIRTIAREMRLGLYRPTDDPVICSTCGFRERCQFSLAKRDFDALQIRQKNGESK